jgi:hypothetical protein
MAAALAATRLALQQTAHFSFRAATAAPRSHLQVKPLRELPAQKMADQK